MSRCNDQTDIAVFCKGANIQDWRAIGKDGFKFYAPEVCGAHQLSHLLLGAFTNSLLQPANIIEDHAVTGIGVTEIRDMEQNDPGPKFVSEPNRVSETFP